MIIEEALFSHLSAFAGLTALVGTRIYPMLLPQQATLPAVTFMKVSNPYIRTFGSTIGAQPRFQFSCWATTYLGAKAVADQIKAALDFYAGTMGGGVVVRAGLVENELDDYDPETKRYHVPVDVILWHEGT